jgi:hypothetical protein
MLPYSSVGGDGVVKRELVNNALGLSGRNPGTGDAVSKNVLFEPWLRQAVRQRVDKGRDLFSME